MKTKASVALFVIMAPVLAGCAGTVGQRATKGAILGGVTGAAVGFIADGPKGAAIGAIGGAVVGGAAGAALGITERASAYAQPQPLSALQGKRVAVIPHPQYGYYQSNIIKPVVEEQLRLRGAGVIYDLPHYPRDSMLESVDLVAEFAATEQYRSVLIDLRLIDPKSRQVVAFGSARQEFGAFTGYTGDFRIEAIRTAARDAVWSLRGL